MLKIILQNRRSLLPFNEPARDLRIQNKPLWLNQRDLLSAYTDQELELAPGMHMPQTNESCLVYSDNLFFTESYLDAFITEAKKRKMPSRAAFSLSDAAFREHCLPLSTSYSQAGDIYLADLWYYPDGPQPGAEPMIIDLQAREIGYYHVPTYMAKEQGDLVYQVPLRGLIAIDSWVHIFIADIVFGLFGRGAQFENRLNKDLAFQTKNYFHGYF